MKCHCLASYDISSPRWEKNTMSVRCGDTISLHPASRVTDVLFFYIFLFFIFYYSFHTCTHTSLEFLLHRLFTHYLCIYLFLGFAILI